MAKALAVRPTDPGISTLSLRSLSTSPRLMLPVPGGLLLVAWCRSWIGAVAADCSLVCLAILALESSVECRERWRGST